jgi:GNAT superfamily N-acetyltransferase
VKDGAGPGDEITAIERTAFDAWPAAEVRALGAWRLRAMRGVTNRGNSVWMGPENALDRAELDARIEAVERFYRERALPALFQLTPLAPPALDGALAARGYAPHAPTRVLVAESAQVAGLAFARDVHAVCEPELDEAWFELSGRRGRFTGDDVDVYRALLGRLAGRAGFARAHLDGSEPAAVGLAFCAPPWAAISSMLTLPLHRRRGLAAAVLAALAGFALSRGAPRLYLQVESQNAPALALYARARFQPCYEYRYRGGV